MFLGISLESGGSFHVALTTIFKSAAKEHLRLMPFLLFSSILCGNCLSASFLLFQEGTTVEVCTLLETPNTQDTLRVVLGVATCIWPESWLDSIALERVV